MGKAARSSQSETTQIAIALIAFISAINVGRLVTRRDANQAHHLEPGVAPKLRFARKSERDRRQRNYARRGRASEPDALNGHERNMRTRG